MTGSLYILLGNLQSGLKAAVGTQCILTAASIGYGCFGRRSSSFQSDGEGSWPPTSSTSSSSSSCSSIKKPEETFDAHHYRYVTEFVTNMYAGRGISSHPYIQLKEEMTFEDPAARCVGFQETKEAFRILRYLEPKSLISPTCIDVKPQGETIDISYALHQQYALVLFRSSPFVLSSILVVTVQLKQRKDIPESDFLLLKMEEQWNGIPLIDSYLFWMVRRINGLVSYQLSSRFL